MNDRFRNAVLHSKSYASANCGSNHLPVICQLRMNLQKLKSVKTAHKLQYNRHLNDLNLKEKYVDMVKSRYNEINENENSNLSTLREL